MSSLEQFIHASASQGIDQKVEALQNLETDLPNITFATIEPTHFDHLLTTLTTHLKSPQQKVHTATLSLLPTLISSLTSTHPNPIQPFKSLLPGIIPTLFDRLADPKERTRELAQGTLLEIYRVVITQGSGGVEEGKWGSVVAYLDKELKGDGFGCKSPRGREQVLSLIVSFVRNISSFPAKQYIPLTIKLLEDQNESVRNAAKEAVITLYNETTIKAMRNDIKNQLTKQQIRQSIVDGILGQLREDNGRTVEVTRIASILELVESTPSSRRETLSSLPSAISSAVATPAKGGSAAPPPSVIPGGTAAPEPDPIMIHSEKELEKEFATFAATMSGKETEQNWESRELALQRLRGLCRGNGVGMEGFVSGLLGVLECITKTMHSLRTALAITSCTTITDLATTLQTKLDPLVDPLLQNLLRLTSQSKKLIITAGTNAIVAILQNASYNVKHLNILINAAGDK
ncbi:suppressor of tub2 mutation, partial [Rhizophlyctis rosea]